MVYIDIATSQPPEKLLPIYYSDLVKLGAIHSPYGVAILPGRFPTMLMDPYISCSWAIILYKLTRCFFAEVK